LLSKIKGTRIVNPSGRPNLGNKTVKSNLGDGRLYFCVVDRFCYTSLNSALVHVSMKHGISTNGELLLRTILIGGVL